MTRSTHIASPGPAEVRALLDAAGWTDYAAAQHIGMTRSAFGQIMRGETRMRGSNWRLLQIIASKAAREALPPPVLP